MDDLQEDLREAQGMLRALADEKSRLEAELAEHHPEHISITHHREILAHRQELYDLQSRLQAVETSLQHETSLKMSAMDERDRMRAELTDDKLSNQRLIETLTAQLDQQLLIIKAQSVHPPSSPGPYPINPMHSQDSVSPSRPQPRSDETQAIIQEYMSARQEAEDKLGEAEDQLRTLKSDNERAIATLSESEKVVHDLTAERDKLATQIEAVNRNLQRRMRLQEDLNKANEENGKADNEIKLLRYDLQAQAVKLEKLTREKNEALEQVSALEERLRELQLESERVIRQLQSRNSTLSVSPSISSTSTPNLDYRDKGKVSTRPSQPPPSLPSVRDVHDENLGSTYPSPTAPFSIPRSPTPQEDLSNTEGAQFYQQLQLQHAFDRQTGYMIPANRHNSVMSLQESSPPPSSLDGGYNPGMSGSSTDLRGGGGSSILAYGQPNFADSGMRKKSSLSSRYVLLLI